MKALIRRRVLRRLIWVYTVCTGLPVYPSAMVTYSRSGPKAPTFVFVFLVIGNVALRPKLCTSPFNFLSVNVVISVTSDIELDFNKYIYIKKKKEINEQTWASLDPRRIRLCLSRKEQNRILFLELTLQQN